MSSVGVRRDVLLLILRMGVYEAWLTSLTRKQRKLMRKRIERREFFGESSKLLRELAAEDPQSYALINRNEMNKRKTLFINS